MVCVHIDVRKCFRWDEIDSKQYRISLESFKDQKDEDGNHGADYHLHFLWC